MAKYLIVNSDDFGISEDVSRGILEAHHQGIVTSTTTMINMPAAESAIKTAQSTAPKLGLGLHFNLSFGKPVSAPETVPSLVTEEGHFVSTLDELRDKMMTFSTEDLERELHAQFDRFCEIAGQAPDHLDAHHGITYSHPVGLDVMLRLAHQHDLPIRWSGLHDKAYDSDTKTLQLLQNTLERYGKPRTCNYLVNPIFDFESSPRLERLKAALNNVQYGYTEFLVHVGYGKDLAEDYNFQRDEELATVTDSSLKPLLEELDIQLCNFGDLP